MKSRYDSGDGGLTVDDLTVFCLLWAVAECFHLSSFGSWVYSPLGILRLLMLVVFFLRPRSLPRFALMVGADALYIFSLVPATANHIVLLGFIDTTLLLLVLEAYWRKVAGDRVALYRRMQGLLRVELVLLYFFAVLHKLNRDYFDPEVSCAGYLLVEMQERFSILPGGSGSIWFSIIGTLLVEAGIVALLLFRSTRLAGIALGLGFHFFLSAHQHYGLYSFSALMFALLYVCLPDGFAARVVGRLRGLGVADRIGRWQRSGLLRRFRVIGAAAGALLLATQLLLNVGDLNLRDLKPLAYTIGQVIWIPYALTLIGLFVLGLTSGRRVWRAPDAFFSFSRNWAWIVPILIFIHSFSPYLGLKTVPVLSMFSNLRTEADLGNHLFIPSSLKLFDYQDDLVAVVESSDEDVRWVTSEGEVIPFFELARAVNRVEGPLTLEYVRNGEAHRFEEALPGERPGIPETPWLQRRLLQFRPVDAEGPNRCRW